MLNYIKHLIECHCTLKIYENKTKPIYHKFVVFSELTNEDTIVEKFVLCNNCDIIHRVYEICKSEIMWGKEGLRSLVVTKEDIKFNLESDYSKIVDLLEKHDNEVADWEYADYLIENNLEGNIVLEKKEISDIINYKILYIKDKSFKIKNQSTQRYV